MKFSDGYWMLLPGVRPYYPAMAYDVTNGPDCLEIVAPTRQIHHRGDTLDGPVLNVRITSPMDDVVHVHVAHWNESPVTPSFVVHPAEQTDVETFCSEEETWLRAGSLTARINRRNWSLAFEVGGNTVTRSGSRGLAMVATNDGNFMHEQLTLGVGECVYGLGERFGPFVKNGQIVECWNKDGGTGSEQAYKNVPFYMTNRGYGVFVMHPEAVSFEVASEKVSRVQFSVEGHVLDYMVIYGPTPREILEKYTRLTGRPALPPSWSFGLWLTTSFTTSYDEATITSFIQGMEDRDLPLHVFHFDCFWMKEYQWCDFRWDERVFPDPKSMLQRIHDRGLKVCVWINPYIAQQSPLFEEGATQGYLLKRKDGSVWQTDQWQAGMGIVDFTNPSACRWYSDHLFSLLQMGVDAFKTDFGERIPTDVAWSDGSSPQKMHNYYSYLYNETVFNLLQRERGLGEAILFARSATAGCQKFPVHWGGDCFSSFESMAESLRGGLSLGLCGFGFWSHDIGGFEGMPPVEVYKRWIAFGLLSSHSRLHGSSSYRVPWLYDEEAVEVLRTFTNLKCRLMPYLFGAAIQANQHGWPVMRAMAMEFPGDRACEMLDRQYMLGDNLLVAPVFSSDGSVDFYLPDGVWTSLLSGQVIAGGSWIREQHNFQSLPLLVRPNSVIALGSSTSQVDYDYTQGVEFFISSLEDGKSVVCEVPYTDGTVGSTVTITRTGSEISANLSGRAENWGLLLSHAFSRVTSAGATVEPVANGVLIMAEPGSSEMSVTLG